MAGRFGLPGCAATKRKRPRAARARRAATGRGPTPPKVKGMPGSPAGRACRGMGGMPAGIGGARGIRQLPRGFGLDQLPRRVRPVEAEVPEEVDGPWPAACTSPAPTPRPARPVDLWVAGGRFVDRPAGDAGHELDRLGAARVRRRALPRRLLADGAVTLEQAEQQARADLAPVRWRSVTAGRRWTPGRWPAATTCRCWSAPAGTSRDPSGTSATSASTWTTRRTCRPRCAQAGRLRRRLGQAGRRLDRPDDRRSGAAVARRRAGRGDRGRARRPAPGDRARVRRGGAGRSAGRRHRLRRARHRADRRHHRADGRARRAPGARP